MKTVEPRKGPYKQEVTGSSPVPPTNIFSKLRPDFGTSQKRAVDDYNFIRPYRVPRFGAEVRTPTVQAGLTMRWITLRGIFSSTTPFLVWKKVK